MGSRGASGGAKGELPGVSKSNTIKAVSMAAMLRDYATPGEDYKYVNREHEMMVDIADTLYNANIGPENLKPEYKEIYDKHDKSWWAKVLSDMGGIDEAMADNNASTAFGGTSLLGQYKKITGGK